VYVTIQKVSCKVNCKTPLNLLVYNEAREEAIILEDHILAVGLKYANLDKKQNAIFERLKEMQKGGGMSSWPKPILHLDRLPCNGPTMIVIKSCGLCGAMVPLLGHNSDILLAHISPNMP